MWLPTSGKGVHVPADIPVAWHLAVQPHDAGLHIEAYTVVLPVLIAGSERQVKVVPWLPALLPPEPDCTQAQASVQTLSLQIKADKL